MAANAIAKVDGVEMVVARTSLARLQIALAMAPPVTRTDWMVALATVLLDGVAPVAKETSVAWQETAATTAPPLT